MTPHVRLLAAQWLANESELARLADLPAGQMDPAARERRLDEQQDEIEFRLGDEQRDTPHTPR